MTKHIADEQLQLAFEKLAELRDMAPLVFKGYDFAGQDKKPCLTTRRDELKDQAEKLSRRKA
jgi:hypothetical protein